MICQNCLKNGASVLVTEITETPQADATTRSVEERHLCEACAQSLNLPHMPALKKNLDIWKLLQLSAQQTRRKGGPACPDCGMTLEEFRKKGRLGCARDYEVFQHHIGELLERIHGARAHVGRTPGDDQADVERFERVHSLRQRLEEAIREEAYESAARLRDEIKALESPKPS